MHAHIYVIFICFVYDGGKIVGFTL